MANVRKNTVESLVLFVLSPFLTVLFQLFFISRGSRFALNILIIILGLVGYIYVPSWTNDKTRYYERYDELQALDLGGFLNYLILQKRPDFVFEFLNYLFASFNMNIQVLFFLINTFSIYTVFKISDLITKYFFTNRRFVCFLLILFSFAVQHLYSGIRFTFASCIFLWGFYYIVFLKRNYIGIFVLILSCLTHFSMIVFVLTFAVYRIFKNVDYKIFFVISFIFLAIPKDFLTYLFNAFNIGDQFSNKVDIYVNGDDFLTQNFANNVSSVIVYYIRNAWVYLAYIYLLFEKGKKEKIVQILFLFIAVLNIFYAFPTIYSRYLILVKFLFTIYLIFKYINYNKKVIYTFLVMYFITIAIDIYVTRPNFVATFNDSSIISLISTLNRKVGLEQMINNKPQ